MAPLAPHAPHAPHAPLPCSPPLNTAAAIEDSPQVSEKVASILSVREGFISRGEGFVCCDRSGVRLFNRFRCLIGSSTCLVQESFKFGAVRSIDGYLVHVGPEKINSNGSIPGRAQHFISPSVRVCNNVVRLDRARAMADSGISSGLGLQPNTVHGSGRVGTNIFPVTEFRANPRSDSSGGVVFVPQPSPPRSTSPHTVAPQIWSGNISDDRRSFAQVAASPPRMDRRNYFGARCTPPRRSPPRNYFGNRPIVGSEADPREE